MNSVKTLCLLNPRAGIKDLDKIKSQIMNKGFWGDIEFYQLKPEEIENPPWKSRLDGFDKVIVIGGDGTLHHVIQNFVGSDMELSFIPAGTANDLCYNIGFDGNMESYIHSLSKGQVVKYDTIEMNGKHVMTGGGFGLGCDVAGFCNTLKNWKVGGLIKRALGKNIYSLTLFTMGLMNFIKIMKVNMTYHDNTKAHNTYALLIANQEMMGRDVKIAPNTKGDDGRFQMIRFENKFSLGVLWSLLRLKIGIKISPKKLYRRELKSITLNFENPVKAYGDGEIFSEKSEWKIRCYKGALSIRMPITT